MIASQYGRQQGRMHRKFLIGTNLDHLDVNAGVYRNVAKRLYTKDCGAWWLKRRMEARAVFAACLITRHDARWPEFKRIYLGVFPMITKRAENQSGDFKLRGSEFYPTTVWTKSGPALVLFTKNELDRAIERGRRATVASGGKFDAGLLRCGDDR